MPLYEYRCEGCGERFEVLQRMGDGPEGLTCPRCGAASPRRQLSTFAAGGGDGFGASGSSRGGCAAPGGSGFT